MIVRREVPNPLPSLGEQLLPMLARAYAARGVNSENELEVGASALATFDALGGVDAATSILANAIERNERILIVGDYDADGATSTALMIRALSAMGAKQVSYLVPNRFEDGYGLSPAIVDAATSFAPQVLVTVDNGISSLDGVAYARERGIRVIVTDHHLPGAALPTADAIVNPNVPGDAFPSKNLAGVGVAFYLLAALRAHLSKAGWFERASLNAPKMAQWLDLVALGTVADVVPLDHNNRILVHQGLARIRARQCCPGISALLGIGKRDARNAVAADLGFAVGPRLNAAGRLNDMTVGIECLLTDQPQAAASLAASLDDLNAERRQLEAYMTSQAEQAVADLRLGADLPEALALFEPDWHAGVVGIVASRVKDRVNRPVIAFAKDGDGSLKGSARSVEGVHIKDALELMAAKTPGLILKFGGHAMAAGMTIAESAFEAFAKEFARVVRDLVGPQGLKVHVFSDGGLDPADRSMAVANLIRQAGPWGQGFAEPQFDDAFEVLEQRIVGGSHLKMILGCAASGRRFDAIAFGLGEQHPCPSTIRAVYRLDINQFRGATTLQLLVQHIEPA